MAALTGLPYAHWQEHLCALLIEGVSADEAVRICAGAGAPEHEAKAIAEDHSRHPVSARLLQTMQQWRTRLCSRDWLFGVYADMAAASGDLGQIDSRGYLSADEFRRDYYFRNRPVRLTQIASGWPAVARWCRDYIEALCGDAVVEVMVGRSSASIPAQYTSNALRRTMRLSEYLTMLYEGGDSNDYYLVSRNRFFDHSQTRALLQDIGPLPFVDTHAPGDKVKLWLGPRGTLTPLHYDDRNSLLVQLMGRKRFRLYPPWVSEYMYQEQRWHAGIDPSSLEPRAFLARAHQAEVVFDLLPGDALFIPVGWWHGVVALDISASLSCLDFGVLNDFSQR